MEPYIGQVQSFGFSYAPRGWAFCSGQIMSIMQNQALFALLGTTYGGDGRTTFALPNLNGRAALGMGNGQGVSPYVEGQIFGVEAVMLSTNNNPTHGHPTASTNVQASSAGGDQNTPVGNTWAGNGDTNQYGPSTTPLVAMSPAAIAVNIGAAGSSQPHDNRQPYLVGNYCIALQGIFPPRS